MNLGKICLHWEEARYGDKQLSQKELRDLDAKVDESLIKLQQSSNDLAKEYGIDKPTAQTQAAATIFLRQEQERAKAKIELLKAGLSATKQDKILQIADRMIAAGDTRPFNEVLQDAAKTAAMGTITAAEIRKPTDPLAGILGGAEATDTSGWGTPRLKQNQ